MTYITYLLEKSSELNEKKLCFFVSIIVYCKLFVASFIPYYQLKLIVYFSDSVFFLLLLRLQYRTSDIFFLCSLCAIVRPLLAFFPFSMRFWNNFFCRYFMNQWHLFCVDSQVQNKCADSENRQSFWLFSKQKYLKSFL